MRSPARGARAPSTSIHEARCCFNRSSCLRQSSAVTGPMGAPPSASSIAGAKTSPRVSLPLPCLVTTSSHTAHAPGTMTQRASVDGEISEPA